MIIIKRNAYNHTVNGFVAAAAVGTVVSQLFVNWLSLCGNSAPALVVFLTGATAGTMFAHWAGGLLPKPVASVRHGHALLVAMAALLLACCWNAPLLMDLTLLAGCETIPTKLPMSDALTFLFPAFVVAIISGIAGLYFRTATTVCGQQFDSAAPQQNSWLRSLTMGGFGAVLILIPMFVPMPLAALSTVAVSVSLVFAVLLEKSAREPDTFSGSELATVASPAAVFHSALTVHSAAAGFLIVATTEIVARLMPTNVPTLAMSIGMSSMLLTMLSRERVVRLLRVDGLNVMALLTLALLPIGFATLASVNIHISNHVSSATGIFLLRSIQCSLLATACLLPALLSSQNLTGQQRRQEKSDGRLELLTMTIAFVVALVGLNSGRSPGLILGAGIALHSIAIFIQKGVWNPATGLESRTGIVRTVRGRVLLALLLISLFPAMTDLNSVRLSSMIFSPRTVAAIERGVDLELIPESDSNRLMLTTSAASGEYSVWRRAGNIVEFQRNGVSLGRVSTETALTPQPPEEILPAILGLVSHPKPARVLVLGDETGASLRTCSNFPIPEIVAIRSSSVMTRLASQYTWASQSTPANKDPRISILHTSPMIALQHRDLKFFDVIVAASDAPSSLDGITDFTSEFYQAAQSRMSPDGIFCQRFRQTGLGPEPVKAVMATMMKSFANVGVVQTISGELVLLASNTESGLVDPDLLKRFQRDHVRQEIAATGWDWAQVAVLPLIDARDPIGIFSEEKPSAAISVQNSSLAFHAPVELSQRFNKGDAIHVAFAPHEIQLLAALTPDEDHKEAARRLSALTQQLEILAGMPDQPWTYRKSLRMEMQRNPRPPQEIIERDQVTKIAHPLDVFSRQYVLSLGRALTAVNQGPLTGPEIAYMDRFTEKPEPLLSHFAHYEIIRLHELAQHPAPADEFRHRLHTVFFTSPSDASVRPVISAIEQLVTQPELIEDKAARYDMLNSLVQKLIERWEARTAWTPRSAKRVQNDVDQSVRVTNRALDLMESATIAADVSTGDFLRRRRYINEALISPLRQYRDQVLAHRLKTETPAEPDSEDPDDLPLLIDSSDNLNTN